MERYICKECGAEATVKDFIISRSCEHTGIVLLDMKVTCYGEGGAQEAPSRLSLIVGHIIGILKAVKP